MNVLDRPPSPFLSVKQIETLGIGLFLAMAVWLGFYQRLIPIFNNPHGEFRYDAIFNYRLCGEIIKTGKIPLVDKLSLYPDGKKLHEELPLLVYYVFWVFHHAAKFLIGDADIKANVLRYNALCGALMALPIFLAVHSMTKKRWVAIVSAFLPSLNPLYIQRTLANQFRYEILGVLLLCLCFSFLIRSLNEPEARRSFLNAAASAVFLFAAFGTWRVSLLFFEILSVASLVIFILYSQPRKIFAAYCALLAAFVAACLVVTYMRAHSYLFTRQSFLALLVAVVMAVSIFRGGGKAAGPTLRMKLLAAALGLGVWAFLPLIFVHDPYQRLSASFARIIAYRLGFLPNLAPEDILYNSGAELLPFHLTEFWSWNSYSSSFLIVVLYFVLLVKERFRPLKEPSHFLILFLFCLFLVLTLFIRRNTTLFIPVSFIAMGNAIHWFAVRLEARYQTSSPEELRTRSFFWGTALVLVLTQSAIHGNLQLMRLRGEHVNYAPPLSEAFRALKQNTKPTDVICAHWQYGYPIQSLCERATVTDGLFEIDQMRGRVLEESEVMAGESEEALLNYCQKYGVNFLFVEYETLLSPVDYQGKRLEDYIGKNDQLTEKGLKTNILKLYFNPLSMPHFRPVYKNQTVKIFEVLKEPAQRPSPPDTAKNFEAMTEAELDASIKEDEKGRRTLSKEALSKLFNEPSAKK